MLFKEKTFRIFGLSFIFLISLYLCGCKEKSNNAKSKTIWFTETTESSAITAKLTTTKECDHVWDEATCLSPKKCLICGKTVGEKTPHEWLEATCLSPKKCLICGMTVGEKAPHEWLDATYGTSKTCAVCGETEGEPLSTEIHFNTEIPQEFNECYSDGRCICSVYISEITYSYKRSYDGYYNIILYFTGEKTYDHQGDDQGRSCHVGIKVYDSEGYVVADSTFSTPSLMVGEKFRKEEKIIYKDLPGGVYIIELTNTNL